jgi:hypothetical protein
MNKFQKYNMSYKKQIGEGYSSMKPFKKTEKHIKQYIVLIDLMQ